MNPTTGCRDPTTEVDALAVDDVFDVNITNDSVLGSGSRCVGFDGELGVVDEP